MKVTVDIDGERQAETLVHNLKNGGFDVEKSEHGNLLYVRGVIDVRDDERLQTFDNGDDDEIRFMPPTGCDIVRVEAES